MPMPNPELEMLDAEVRRADDDERARQNDEQIDAVGLAPARNLRRIDLAFFDAEARERERRAGNRRRAVREQRERANQLRRARVQRRPVVSSDDLQRFECPMDDAVDRAHQDGGDKKRGDGVSDRRIAREVRHLDHNRCIFR